MAKGRSTWGYPDWNTTSYWTNTDILPRVAIEECSMPIAVKNPGIAKLDNYEELPPAEFWENFPFRELPSKCSTKVDVEKLQYIVNSVEGKMTSSQRKRAWRIIADLRNGASACQKSLLPPITVPNAKSAFEHGEFLTDKIVTWINCGFVAGPFQYSPVPGFRSNAIMAIARNGKVRPIINLSAPKGRSYNDNIDRRRLEKVNMATARSFSYLVKENGKDARMWKFDICDAYKLVPAIIEELRLQGFTWLGRHFVETQKMFGGADSVCGFDRLGDTLENIAVILSETRPDWVIRALDDFAHICPRNYDNLGKFAWHFKKLCETLKIDIAENCPKMEKAFENSTRGVVLGVGFDTSNASWYLPEVKAEKIMRRCYSAVTKSHMSLKETEKLMGSVNDLCQVCRFAKFYKSEGYRLLRSFHGNENLLIMSSKIFKEDMKVILKIAESAKFGLPISPRPTLPSLAAQHFYSDASGASLTHVRGERKLIYKEGIGAACLGGDSIENVWCWHKLHWPSSFISECMDEKGCYYGSKSTTLECIGLLLPLIAIPEELAGREIVYHVDNTAVGVGWHKGYVKNDATATIFLRCIHSIAMLLGTMIHVVHVKRMSNDMAALADKLSRTDKWDRDEKILLKGKEVKIRSQALLRWLKHPVEDWSLPQTMADESACKILK